MKQKVRIKHEFEIDPSRQNEVDLLYEFFDEALKMSNHDDVFKVGNRYFEVYHGPDDAFMGEIDEYGNQVLFTN